MPLVVYINLERARERRAFMEAQGERLGLPLARFVAVEPKDVSDAVFARLGGQWERPLSRVEVAVFLSHRAQWERAADEPEGLLVLEDDVVLSPRLPAFLADPPRDFDLVNIETVGRPKFFRAAPAPARRLEGTRISPVARDKSGAGAYYLSQGGARRLLREADRSAALADAFLYRSGRLRIAQAEPVLAIQVHILAARGVASSIRTETQIGNARPPPASFRHWLRHRARRLATQIRLTPYHLGRLGPLRFREPEVDEGEFAQARRPEA